MLKMLINKGIVAIIKNCKAWDYDTKMGDYDTEMGRDYDTKMGIMTPKWGL